MIKVNETYISADVDKIIDKLKLQLETQGIKRFYKSIDTPNNYMVCCPIHKNGQERKPSMGILKSDGTSHCFACGYVASLPEMISNCLGYDDMGSVGSKWLIRNFQSISVEEREDIDIDFSRGVKPIHNTNYVTEEELDKYRWTHPYWKKRGITDEGIIELFDLGYDKETDCITMPVRDKSGHTLFVARRSVKTKFFNYPEGVEKPLYGLYEIFQDLKNIENEYDCLDYEVHPEEIIVCESMIDALTCWQYGKYAVALNGLGTSEQFKQLQRLNCRKLIIATDNDKAGQAARYRIKQNIKNKILTQYVLPQGRKDINDLTEDEFNNLPEIFL